MVCGCRDFLRHMSGSQIDVSQVTVWEKSPQTPLVNSSGISSSGLFLVAREAFIWKEKKTYLQQVQSKFVILWVRPVALSHVNICNASLTFSFSWTKMSKCSVALCLAFFSEPTTTPESIIVRRRQHRKHLHRGSAECLIMMAKSQCTMETQRARGCCLKVDTRKISSLQGTRAGNCLFSPSFFS